MAASVFHTVRVQDAMWPSRRSETPRLPRARLACRDERTAKKRNGTRNRHERTRKRVTETTGMSHIRSCFGFELGEFSSRLMPGSTKIRIRIEARIGFRAGCNPQSIA